MALRAAVKGAVCGLGPVERIGQGVGAGGCGLRVLTRYGDAIRGRDVSHSVEGNFNSLLRFLCHIRGAGPELPLFDSLSLVPRLAPGPARFGRLFLLRAGG